MLSTRAFLSLCLASLALLLTPLAAQAATINVSPAAPDEGVSSDDLCSLREAVISSNLDSVVAPDVSDCTAGSGADMIQLGGNDVTLTLAGANEDFAETGDLDVTDDLTITSSTGNPQIDQAAVDRVFNSSGSNLTLQNLTVTGGDLSASIDGIAQHLLLRAPPTCLASQRRRDARPDQQERIDRRWWGGIFSQSGSVVVENGSNVQGNKSNSPLATNLEAASPSRASERTSPSRIPV